MTREATPNSTLEELEGEGERWSEPNWPSHLVAECHRLRKLQLRLFTIENLRLMLGQDTGARYLVPLALEHLEAEPLAAGDFHPGDLLCNVLSLPQEFWIEHPGLKTRVAAVAARAMGTHEHGEFAEKALRKAYRIFSGTAG